MELHRRPALPPKGGLSDQRLGSGPIKDSPPQPMSLTLDWMADWGDLGVGWMMGDDGDLDAFSVPQGLNMGDQDVVANYF